MSDQLHEQPLDVVLVGYDASPSAAAAIGIGARLLPGREARIAHLWTPPNVPPELRHEVFMRARGLDHLADLLEQEGQGTAARVADQGVALARAAGWEAHALPVRSFGDPGFELARLASEHHAGVTVVGSRGLSGIRAALGSVSDGAAHYSPVPVLVVPELLLQEDRRAAADGPILVAHDGSATAGAALAGARTLFAGRSVVVATVGAHGDDDGVPPEAIRLQPVGVTENARAVADALARHAREIGAAAIVVGSRGRSAAKEILLGSVAMATLHHAHRPVVVVPDHHLATAQAR